MQVAPCGRRVFNTGQGLQLCASCDSFHVCLQSHIQLGMRESCLTAPSPGAIFITLMLFSLLLFQHIPEHRIVFVAFPSSQQPMLLATSFVFYVSGTYHIFYCQMHTEVPFRSVFKSRTHRTGCWWTALLSLFLLLKQILSFHKVRS